MLEPIGDKVFVKIREDSLTESGLVIPDSAVPTRFVADVLYVGPAVRQVKQGDVVVVNPVLYGHVPPVLAGGEKLFSFAEAQILGIVRDASAAPVSA